MKSCAFCDHEAKSETPYWCGRLHAELVAHIYRGNKYANIISSTEGTPINITKTAFSINKRVVFFRKTFTLTEQQVALSVESGLVAEEVLRATQT